MTPYDLMAWTLAVGLVIGVFLVLVNFCLSLWWRLKRGYYR